jgi:hypothetical protein
MLTDTGFRRKRERQNVGHENASDEPEKRERDNVRAEGRRKRPDPACAPEGALFGRKNAQAFCTDKLRLADSAARVPYSVGATAPISWG